MNTALEIIGGIVMVPEFTPEAVRGLMQRLDLN